MGKTLSILGFVLTVWCCRLASCETWYVDGAVIASGDGMMWETAFKKIQEGIDAASDGDPVIIAEGTYVENIHFHGKNITLTGTDPLDATVVANTIIDGSQSGSVVTFLGTENEACVLSGFTIRNGSTERDGGGVCGTTGAGYTRATILANMISANSAHDGGGLACCQGAISNNIIVKNSASGIGGGLYSCLGTVENNTIYGNSASKGGGISGWGDRVANCIIWENTATYGSPQVYVWYNLTYCCIEGWAGGGKGNFFFAPAFVDAEKGDFHLKSWSPCIDAGDPSSDFSNEPEPNGGRVDMGAYGNTREATSKSPDSDNDQLPDDWEMEFFADLRQGWNDDMDGDLITNAVEYQQGYHASTPPSFWYVDAAVPVPGNGRSWGTAFRTIQDGVDAAPPGDTVIVAQGTYVENVSFSGKIIILRGTDPLAPDVVARTIIRGRVTFFGSEHEPCALSGFTIQGGDGDYGGGICGGERSYGTYAAIRNNVITGNSAYLGGGGIAFCDGRIENNRIVGNAATGGLFDEFCVWDIPAGGGLYECHGPIRGNIISENSATYGGGLCSCWGTISDNLITRNHVMKVFYIGGPDAGDEEWVPGAGGGASGCGEMVNNTICDNSSEGSVGGVASVFPIVNCIIWGNTAPDAPQLSESASPSHSCIEDWTGGGIGNFSEDPLFVSAEANDYHLQPDSSCIGAGLNYLWFLWPQRDLDGNCRLVGERVDMGCYEYGSSRDTDGDLLSDADEGALGADSSRDDADADGLRDGIEVLRGTDPLVTTPSGILYVPADFGSIQAALFLCGDGDQVVVAPGTYYENLRLYGSDVILRSTDPANPDVVASTILDGSASGMVVRFTGEESGACVLSGFTIRNGWGGVRGAGYAKEAQATIQRNIITGHSGMPALYYCDGPVENNIIRGNSGGGLDECDGPVRGNLIAGNSGSGLRFCDGVIQGNLIVGNSSGAGAGLRDCHATLRNNVIIGNSATQGGGMAGCSGTIENCTIAANSAIKQAGGLYQCNAAVINCIIWGNTAPEGAQTFESPNITYSCIQDWAAGGEGNIADDPVFVDPDGPDDDPVTHEDNDYRVNAASPCIDVGKNEEWMRDAEDLDGNPRIWNGTVDMGASEYGSFHFKITQVTEVGGRQLTWSSRPGDAYTIWSCDDLAVGDWTEEATVASGGQTTTWTDANATQSRQKFYRIQIYQ